MVDYIPLSDIDVRIESSMGNESGVNQFHVELSDILLEFNKANQSKSLLITNIGWDKLPFKGLISVGSLFVVTQALPALLLPGKSYPINVLYNTVATAQNNGGIYVDVGNSYGHKFIQLSGKIT